MRAAAVVRIATGLLFVAEGYAKVAGEFVCGGFHRQAARMAGEAFPFWRHFLESAVLPHAGIVAWIFALGELAVGLGLLFGLLTRAAGAAGMALMVSLLFADGNAGSGASWTDWITAGLSAKLALLLLALLLALDAGMTWGLDARVFRRRRRVGA